MTLNERLKLARAQKGFTQQEVADILHISRATVSSWEVGRTLPSFDFIIDLSNLYDLSLDILLKEDMTMINQVNKELRNKKVYKGIVLTIGIVLSMFIVINLVWLFNVKNQYNYINKNWETKENYYFYKKDDIFMRSPQLSFKDEFRFHYLNSQPLWIMGFKGSESEKDYMPSVTFRDTDKGFATVPINKTEDRSMFIRIDKNGKLMEDEDNPDFININPNGEDVKFINSFLDEHNDDFKQLYSAVEKQFNLVNNISK